MTFDPRTHWRGLIGSTAILMAAVFVLPPWLPQPDLNENRDLAKAPAAPQTFSDLKAYPRAIDRFVADRFPARTVFIGALNLLRMKAGVSGSDQVIVGRDGWLFYDSGNAMGGARNDPVFTDAQAKTWLEALAGRTETLASQGVPYLVVVPPGKEVVFPEHGPAWYSGPDLNRPAAMLSRLSETAHAGHLLYLFDALKQPSQWGLKTYSLHDTHWSGLGAYFGYVAIMRRLRAMGVVQEDSRPIEDFTEVRATVYAKPRDLALMLGVASYVKIDYPELEDPAQQRLLRTEYLTANAGWDAPHVIETGVAGKPTLLLLMDSYSNALAPFLYSHFSRIVVAHNQDGTWRQDMVDRFKPDVVITEIAERGVVDVMSPSPPASDAARRRIAAALARPHRFEAERPEYPRRIIGGADGDRIAGTSGRDELMGKGGGDSLDGRNDNDQIRGGLGNDLIKGGQGDDWLSGERGDDTLTGGEGADVFHSFAGAGVDQITDFNPDEGDRIELDAGTVYKIIQTTTATNIDIKGARITIQPSKSPALLSKSIFLR